MLAPRRPDGVSPPPRLLSWARSAATQRSPRIGTSRRPRWSRRPIGSSPSTCRARQPRTTPTSSTARRPSRSASTLQQSGFRLRLEGLGGTYGFEQAPTNVTTTGKQYEGGALVGYQQVWNFGSLGAFVGANVRENTVPSSDPNSTGLGTQGRLQGSGRRLSAAGACDHDVGLRVVFHRIRRLLRPFSRRLLAVRVRLSRAGGRRARRRLLQPDPSRRASLGDAARRPAVGVSGGYVWDRAYKDGYYGSLELRTGF